LPKILKGEEKFMIAGNITYKTNQDMLAAALDDWKARVIKNMDIKMMSPSMQERYLNEAVNKFSHYVNARTDIGNGEKGSITAMIKDKIIEINVTLQNDRKIHRDEIAEAVKLLNVTAKNRTLGIEPTIETANTNVLTDQEKINQSAKITNILAAIDGGISHYQKKSKSGEIKGDCATLQNMQLMLRAIEALEGYVNKNKDIAPTQKKLHINRMIEAVDILVTTAEKGTAKEDKEFQAAVQQLRNQFPKGGNWEKIDTNDLYQIQQAASKAVIGYIDHNTRSTLMTGFSSFRKGGPLGEGGEIARVLKTTREIDASKAAPAVQHAMKKS